MKTGVYIIINNITGDSYVGSSSINIYYRIQEHKRLLRNNKHHSIHLQRAYNKYKEKAFNFKILELVKPKLCIEKEQYYIDTINPRYNICKKADSRLGTKVDPKVSKRIGKLLRGRKLPPRIKEWSDKISKGALFTIKNNNKTGCPGIHKTEFNKYIVRITYNKKRKYIGFYDSFKIALKYWKKAIIKLYGNKKLKMILLKNKGLLETVL